MKMLLMTASCALAATAQAAPLQLVTENNPPFTILEGKEVKGTAADAVRALLVKAGVEGAMTVHKWNDAYAKAQTSANVCIFGTARLENREKLFKWYGPVATNTWALYSLPAFDKKIATPGDARFYKIGGVKNDAKVDFMRAEGASSIREAASDAENPGRLMKPKSDPDHIDLWVTSTATAQAMAEKVGVKGLKEVLVVRKQDLFLACNPRTEKAVLDKLAGADKK